MSCSDPIADMLTCIRNASRAGLPATEMGHSRLKAEVARILKKEGYIADVATAERDGKKVLRVTLKYDYNEKPIIQQLRRVSRPGLRRYVGAAAVEEDGELFEEKMERLSEELLSQFEASASLQSNILQNLRRLGYDLG